MPTFTVGYFGVHGYDFLCVFYLFSTLKQGSERLTRRFFAFSEKIFKKPLKYH